jgi:hypothetical protein
MKTNIALAIFVLPAFGIGGRDPEQGLAVAPSRHIVVFVLELEPEKGQELVVKSFRAREIADAEDQVVNTDDARHEISS